MSVLVTGGAGYIGSHVCVELLDAGYDVVVIDNLSNSKREALNRVMEITGKTLRFYRADLRDRDAMEDIFKKEDIDSVMHFAGLKAVGESVSMPLSYYSNNITGTLVLCGIMERLNIKRLVFSSSATVYGDPHTVPIREDSALSATNPYGRTKLMIEEILRDLHRADEAWNIASLRYFNPVGAHCSGLIGEDPNGIPNNLVPYISQVAVGKLACLNIYGGDYPTRDGTGVRDYIHVTDLALGHIKALEKLDSNPGWEAYNLGTGKGYSVLEMVEAFSRASGRDIPYRFAGRRPGDVAVCCADPSRARARLGWSALKSVDDMCADTWRWQRKNPDGF